MTAGALLRMKHCFYRSGFVLFSRITSLSRTFSINRVAGGLTKKALGTGINFQGLESINLYDYKHYEKGNCILVIWLRYAWNVSAEKIHIKIAQI